MNISSHQNISDSVVHDNLAKNTEQTITQANKSTPSQTILIYKVPMGVTLQMIQQLFEKEPGYVKCRNVRNIFFIDFVTIPVALAAMRRYQGYKFPGYEKHHGLVIDYDNDASSNSLDLDKLISLIENDTRFHIDQHCPTCTSKILLLRLLPPLTQPTLPRRNYDNFIVIDCSKTVLEHYLITTDPEPEFRENGVEIRYLQLCKTCGDQLGYSFTSAQHGIKFIFLTPHVLAYDIKSRQIAVSEKTTVLHDSKPTIFNGKIDSTYYDEEYSLISK